MKLFENKNIKNLLLPMLILMVATTILITIYTNKQYNGLTIILNEKIAEIVGVIKEKYPEVDNDQIIKLLNSDKDVLIIDVRSEYEYEKGHLLNAINLPYDDDDFKSELNEIIDYKDKTVLVYCRSGNRSEKAAVKLVDNGFKNVKNVTDGVDEYDYKLVKVDNITGREAEKMINDDKHDKDLIILDVREPKDFNNGHLLNAINIPIEDIDKRMDELRNYKSKDIIVYCNTGRKSAEVAEKLVEHGFTDVTNIVDGVSEYDFKLVK